MKTILFASLIVAMVLPFSGMQFATAEETAGQSTVSKMAQAIAELREQKKATYDEEEKQQIKDIIQKLKIAKALAKLDARGLSNSPQAQELYLELRDKIDATGNAVESKLMSESEIVGYQNMITTQGSYQYDRFATGQQVTFSCNKTMTGQTTGSLTQYDRTSYLVATPNYPSVFDCTKIHNETVIRVTDLSGSLLNTCDVSMPYSSGVTAFVKCDDFGLHDDRRTTNIVMVESNAWYENGWLDTAFTFFYGWT